MKRLLTAFVVAAMALIGFAPLASAEDGDSSRCDRLADITERLDAKMERIAKKGDRIEARMAKVQDRLDGLDPEHENFEERSERIADRMDRLDARAAKNATRAERVTEKMDAVMEQCGVVQDPPPALPTDDTPAPLPDTPDEPVDPGVL